MKNIATALVKAKKAFSPALKDKTNPAFRSKYADLGACLEAVNDALLENGIALYQETSEDPNGVTVETVLLHESGETIRNGKLHVPAMKQDPQGYGSALTYARRYSLMAACGIAPEDDDGNAASKTAKGVPMVDADKRTPSVAQTVLDQSDAIPAARKTELAVLANKVGQAMLSKGAPWCHDRLEEESLDDVELIYLSTLLTPGHRNALKAESIARRTQAA